MEEEPNIGRIIKDVLHRQGRSITWLADELHYSRQNMYKIFTREWIHTDLLLKISIVMNHDFYKYFSDYQYTNKKELLIDDAFSNNV